MAVIDPRTWLEHLTPAQCWQLLASTLVGRVGVLHEQDAPEIYPVNHAVDQGSMVSRTDPGTKLHSLIRSPAVCFEADAVDPASAAGWSVLVKGRAKRGRYPNKRARLRTRDLRYWALGPKAHWVRMVAAEITGRRIWAPAPDDRGA